VLIALTQHIASGLSLADAQVADAIAQLTDPEVPVEAKADFLIALSARGETEAELAAFARELRARALRPELPGSLVGRTILDVCGTGGDRLNTFNISTAVAILAAATGVCVAKHGNRAITSKSGSADVLEALGIPIDLPPDTAAQWLARHHFAFLFAPNFHPAFRNIALARKLCAARGARTLFNFLGPLLNPVAPAAQLIGVPRRELCGPMARVLRSLGTRSARVVCGATAGGNLDEVSLSGETFSAVFENGGEVREETLHPVSLGLDAAPVESLAGGDAATNAQLIRALLSGELTGPKRDVVLLNAGVALHIAGVAPTIPGGIRTAAATVDSGTARAKLDELAAAGEEWKAARA